jgi:hypothetical protein
MAKTDSKTASNVVDIAQARAAHCIRRAPTRQAAFAAL